MIHRSLLALSVVSLLFLSACSDSGTRVFNKLGNTVGRIRVQDQDEATVYDRNSAIVGKVTDTTVRDENSARVGRIVVTAGQATIYDRNGKELGGLEDSVDCFSETGKELGRIGAKVDIEAAAGGCLLLLILGN